MSYISSYLQESLNKNDIEQVRSALLGYFDLNPAFKENHPGTGKTDYDDAIEYIRGRYPSIYHVLFEEHDDSIFPSSTLADKDTYYEINSALRINFSKKRIESLRSIGKKAMLNDPVYSLTVGHSSTTTYVPSDNHVQRMDDNSKKALHRKSGVNIKALLIIAVITLVVVMVLIALLHFLKK